MNPVGYATGDVDRHADPSVPSDSRTTLQAAPCGLLNIRTFHIEGDDASAQNAAGSFVFEPRWCPVKNQRPRDARPRTAPLLSSTGPRLRSSTTLALSSSLSSYANLVD